MAEVDVARSADLEWSLRWSVNDRGGLSGELLARNVSDRPVVVGGKPSLTPLGVGNQPLDARCLWTLELRVPDHVVVEPGASARSRVGWAGWDGPDPSGSLIVTWRDGQVLVRAEGAVRPASAGPPTNLYSSWFELV